MKRQCGILTPVFSLPNEYGIGDFGKGAYEFIGYLKKAGQSVWQILPLVMTGFGNSPYSSVCSYSFSPYFISPEELLKKGLATPEEIEFCKTDSTYVDYGFLYSVRLPLLKKAYSRFDKEDAEFKKFKQKGEFYNYALYMALKYASGQKHFYEWEDRYKYRDTAALTAFYNDYFEEVDFWQFVQFEAEREWSALKKYANDNGISIFGDLPLYPALDSVDVWENPSIFKLAGNFVPKAVAGVPPDYFCESGQLWGNPVYDYQEMSKDGFSWWANRIKKALTRFDYIRIDHFRGLDRFYEVPFGAVDARHGEWVKVPSDELFAAIHRVADKNRIIAEDLGIIDDGVRELIKKTGYPNMKILLFAFNGEKDNLYLPENITENSVCYTGTHDNDTLIGYLSGASAWDENNFRNGIKNSLEKFSLDLPTDTYLDLADATIELGFLCKAKMFILPMQDVLKKGTEYRINEPGTVKAQNWAVRLNKEDFDLTAAIKLKGLAEKYDRLNG